MDDISNFVKSEARKDMEELLYATDLGSGAITTLYSANCEAVAPKPLKDRSRFADIVYLAMNGDISYSDALRWCEINDAPKEKLESHLIIAEYNRCTAEAPRFHLMDILFKVVDFLNEIIGWILEDIDLYDN